MTKLNLRKIYLEKRKNLSPAQRAEKSAIVAERFFERFDLTGIKFLHCYVPIEKLGEINTRLIFDRIENQFPHVATVAPRADFASGEMESVRLDSMSALVPSQFGIDEPESGETVEPEKIDIVLTPLLCFDDRGFRVGYGKGFYDKFFRQCRSDCLKIGLSFFEPTAEIIDTNDFDVKLDYCVTPEKIYEFSA